MQLHPQQLMSLFWDTFPEAKGITQRRISKQERKSRYSLITNGEEVFTGDIVEQVMPHDHSHVIAEYTWLGKRGQAGNRGGT